MGQLNVSVVGAIGQYDAPSPLITGAYVASLTDAPGVVAANNFMTINNPSGNTKTIVLLGLFVSTYVASGASATRNSLQGMLANTISGGTVMAASAIAKFSSAAPAATAEIRTGNPTVTTAANIFNSPPAINTSTAQYVHSVGSGASLAGGTVTLLPNEGFVIRTAVGNTAQTWNISLLWGEI